MSGKIKLAVFVLWLTVGMIMASVTVVQQQTRRTVATTTTTTIPTVFVGQGAIYATSANGSYQDTGITTNAYPVFKNENDYYVLWSAAISSWIVSRNLNLSDEMFFSILSSINPPIFADGNWTDTSHAGDDHFATVAP